MNQEISKSSPVISPARLEDAEAIQALAHVVWHAHYPGIITVAQIEYMLAQRYDPQLIRDEIAGGEVRWDVLWVDGGMTAFASYFLSEPRTVKLDKLYVHPGQQRKGHGRMLIAHACRAVRAMGGDALMLAVNKRNASAITAYLKHGFRIAESITKDIGGGFVMDDYIMVKAVNE
jgi:diamine N-acetyltransferase